MRAEPLSRADSRPNRVTGLSNMTEKIVVELTPEEYVLIITIRKNPLLKKAVLNYFESMSGIDLSCIEVNKNKK